MWYKTMKETPQFKKVKLAKRDGKQVLAIIDPLGEVIWWNPATNRWETWE